MNLGIIFLKAHVLGFITLKELDWITENENSFSRIDMALVIKLGRLMDKGFIEIVEFFSNKISKLLFSLFIIFGFFFSALSISEVFEDYIDENNLKNVANRLLYLSAIVFPFLTLLVLFNLNL